MVEIFSTIAEWLTRPRQLTALFAILILLLCTLCFVEIAEGARQTERPNETDIAEKTTEESEYPPEYIQNENEPIIDQRTQKVVFYYEIFSISAVGEPWANKKIDLYEIADAIADDFTPHYISEYERYGGAFPLCVQAYTKYVCDIYGVDYTLILAMIETESGYKYDALSSAGCVGFMQISEKWHKDRMSKCGVEDLRDPYGNILVGVDFVAELLERYDGNVLKALAAYNMGASGAYRNLWQYGIYEYTYTDKVLSKQAAIAEELNY